MDEGGVLIHVGTSGFGKCDPAHVMRLKLTQDGKLAEAGPAIRTAELSPGWIEHHAVDSVVIADESEEGTLRGVSADARCQARGVDN